MVGNPGNKNKIDKKQTVKDLDVIFREFMHKKHKGKHKSSTEERIKNISTRVSDTERKDFRKWSIEKEISGEAFIRDLLGFTTGLWNVDNIESIDVLKTLFEKINKEASQRSAN